MRTVFLSMLVVWLFMSPAHAWHEAGHKMTARIAFNLLGAEQRQQVAGVLRAHPRFRKDFAAAMPEEIANGSEREKNRWLFERASIWPDLVANFSEAVQTRYLRGTWHYINLPVYLTGKDEKELANNLQQNLSMEFAPPLRQNLNIVQALKGNLLIWRDTSAANADKAVALCWILHLTGDLHQPLHNVALFSRTYFPTGDRGGNSIAIKRKDGVTNLHAVWDGLANRFDKLAPDENTKELLANDDVHLQSINGWARHHRKMAMELVYTGEVKRKLLKQVANQQNPEISLSAEYLSTACQVARPQVIIAGHRIAALMTH
ncbi:MAG: S1/P1 nuclease [Proteobacteria bacterium]|nr:S1/P1 nuclease [Pseudomonadota bacterium]